MLSNHLDDLMSKAETEVRQLDPDFLLGTPTAALIDGLLDRHGITAPSIVWDEATQLGTMETTAQIPGRPPYGDRRRTRMHAVPASMITIAVPVTGDLVLLGGRPSTYLDRLWPNTEIIDDELHVSRVLVEPTPEDLRRWWQREQDEIGRQVSYIQADVGQWQAWLPTRLSAAVEARRKRLLNDRGLEGALGMTVRHRTDRPTPVPIQRKRVATTRALKSAPSRPFAPEPELDTQTYLEILDIIGAFTRSFERSPGVAQKFNEEELRDQILMQLNGHFEGEAAAELFNGAGKTDILIRHQDRNVFIAECKFWSGAARLGKAIDQLLGYLVWRDTKAALIVFIREANPSAITEKARAAVEAHPRFKRFGAASPCPDMYTNYVLTHGDDDQREIRVALLPVVIRPAAAN